MLSRVLLLGLLAPVCNSLPTNPIDFDGYKALRQIALTLDYVFDTHRSAALGRTHHFISDPEIANFTAFVGRNCTGETTTFIVNRSHLDKCSSFRKVDPPSCMGHPPACGFQSVSVNTYDNPAGHQYNLFTSIDDHCGTDGPALGVGGCYSPDSPSQLLESFEVLQTSLRDSLIKSECPQSHSQDRVVIVG